VRGDAASSFPVDEASIEKRWFLLARVDHEKFDYFYDKYYDRIFRYIFHRTRDRDLAEELTSETFFRALRALWKFRWQGITFAAWLYRIAINVVNRHYQWAARRRERPLNPPDREFEAGLMRDPADDPYELLENAEEQERLLECLGRLDLDSQNILALRYFEGLKVREIAVITDTPEGTVKARISRSLCKLRSILEETA